MKLSTANQLNCSDTRFVAANDWAWQVPGQTCKPLIQDIFFTYSLTLVELLHLVPGSKLAPFPSLAFKLIWYHASFFFFNASCAVHHELGCVEAVWTRGTAVFTDLGLLSRCVTACSSQKVTRQAGLQRCDSFVQAVSRVFPFLFKISLQPFARPLCLWGYPR
jgi:hypothetical protein